MKRCPECDFLYLDSDQFCDLDGALLMPADPNSQMMVEETEGRRRWQGWKIISIVAVAGVALGIILFLVYQRLTRRTQPLNSNRSSNLEFSQQPAPIVDPTPQMSLTATPEPSISEAARPTPTTRATSGRAKLSSNPVSTSVDERVQRKVIIRLSDGGAIAADETWRTKDGIWYRRNGIVTLLKRSQVKTIEKAP